MHISLRRVGTSEHTPCEPRDTELKNQPEAHLESGQGQRSHEGSELGSAASTLGGSPEQC